MKKKVGLFILVVLLLSVMGPGCSNSEVDLSKVQFIAHRGLSAEYYQNTLEAFEKAAESEFFSAIETDVWCTTDRVWVCTHDRDPFENTTLFIDEISFELARSSPLAHSKSRGVEVEGDVFICSLEEYLEVCSRSGMIAIIEIKNDYSKDELVDLIEVIKSILSDSQFMIITFFTDNLPIIKEIDPTIQTQALASAKKDAKKALSENYNLGVSQKSLTKQNVKQAHEKNLIINVWTVNEEKQAKKYIKMGVDFITTDKILIFD